MKKILITGGAGFIGFHLAKLLMMSGYDITIVDNFARAVLDDDLNLLVKNKGVRINEIKSKKRKITRQFKMRFSP